MVQIEHHATKVEPNRIICSMLFALMAIMPVVDAVNGYVIGQGASGGLTIGIIYRIALVALCIALFVDYPMDKEMLVVFCLLIAFVIIPHMLDLTSISFLSMTVKLVLPILLIETFRNIVQKNPLMADWPSRLVSIWTYMFVLIFLGSYVLNIGYYTYEAESTGYKAFFEAQNSLVCALLFLFVFSTKNVFEAPKFTDFVKWLLLLACLFLTGLKAAYLMSVVVVAIFFISSRISIMKKAVIATVICLCAVSLCIIFSAELESVISRWFFHMTNRDFISFATSGRTDRIPYVFQFLNTEAGHAFWPLFGSGESYSVAIPHGYVAIEMDLPDIFFQFGIMGLATILYCYLSRYIWAPRRSFAWMLSFWIIALLSIFSGHVLESGLGGMVLAVAVWGLYGNCDNKAEKSM